MIKRSKNLFSVLINLIFATKLVGVHPFRGLNSDSAPFRKPFVCQVQLFGGIKNGL